MPLNALCRAVSPAMLDCELSFIGREPIDLALANTQHNAYVQALRALNVEVIELPAEATMPDSVFVEDTVLLYDELAVLTRPGALSRRGEVASIEVAFKKYREVIAHITAPGTIDGGDVLRIGKRVFVGMSRRSNRDAIEQLTAILKPYGYSVTPVAIQDCLHLKSGVTALSDDTVLVNPLWVDAGCFNDYKQIRIDETEEHSANVVRVNSDILMPASFPKTQAIIEATGFRVHTVDLSEIQKAEGAITCCSVLFKA